MPLKTKKSSISSKKRNKKARSANGARVVIVFCIVAAMVAVVVAAGLRFLLTDEKVAMQKLDFLAKTYYEDYYYDNFQRTLQSGSAGKSALERYSKYGFAPVHLRQLLLFNDGEYADYRKYFDGKCDTNTTLIYYYPQAPYGKTDYTTSYELDCTF